MNNRSLSSVDDAPTDQSRELVNAMSVDVEEHFQVSAFDGHIARRDWDNIPSRVSRNVDRILQLFDDSGTKATFFVLGWIAERQPEIVKSIAAEGHEIASHGYDHRRVESQTPQQFLADVSRTRGILEEISGNSVVGYRAPSFSIGQKTLWAHDVLTDAGYQYSSSVYPIKHDHYGFPSAPRFPFRGTSHGILEIPLTTASIAGKNLPGAGGGYFRLLPRSYSCWAIDRVNKREKMPAFFYFHPWELDPNQPRVSGISTKARIRHYVNLGRFEARLVLILREFTWGRIDVVCRDLLRSK